MLKQLSSHKILWATGGVALAVLCVLAFMRAQERVAIQSSATQSPYSYIGAPGGGSTSASDVTDGSGGSGGGVAEPPRYVPTGTYPGDRQSNTNPSLVSSIASNISEAFGVVSDAVVGIFVPTDTPVTEDSTSGGDTAAPADSLATKEVNFSPDVGPLTGLSGTIQSVGTGSFVLSTVIPNEGVKITTVSVDSSTAISRLVAKDPTAYENQRAQAEASGLPPPEPYTNETIGLSDLSEGMLVTVEFTEVMQATAASARAKTVGVLPVTL